MRKTDVFNFLGFSSYAFTWAIGVPGYPAPKTPMTALDLINTTAQLGGSVLQLADNVALHTMSKRDLHKLRDEAYRRGIELQVGTRGVDVEILLAYADLAIALGAQVVRTLLDTDIRSPTIDEAITCIQTVLPRYSHDGLTLVIENHDKRKASELCTIMEKFSSANLGICFDTANSLGALENPYEVAVKLSPYVRCVHLKDVIIYRPPHQQGFIIEGCSLNQGMLDVERILSILFSATRKVCPILVELWVPYKGSPEETARLEEQWRSMSFMAARNLLERLVGQKG